MQRAGEVDGEVDLGGGARLGPYCQWLNKALISELLNWQDEGLRKIICPGTGVGKRL